MSRRPTRLERSARFRLSRLARGAVTLAGGLAVTLAMQAHAAVMPGDQFVYNWTEITGRFPGLTGTVDITIGAPTNTPGFFSFTVFDITQSGGFCGVCTPLTEDLTKVSFNSATLGVLGEVTGSFLGQGGGFHTFDLLTADLPGGTWTFTDVHVTGGFTEVSTGTYTTTVKSVDEPSGLLLLGLGVGALAWFRRRRNLGGRPSWTWG